MCINLICVSSWAYGCIVKMSYSPFKVVTENDRACLVFVEIADSNPKILQSGFTSAPDTDSRETVRYQTGLVRGFHKLS